MFNSSHTPNVMQQWLILPEWAIGSIVGFLATAAVGYLLIGRREQALFWSLRMSRWFGRRSAR